MPVWAGDFLSNRGTLLTGGVDRTIRRWDAETGQPLTLRREEPKARWLLFAGVTFATCSGPGMSERYTDSC